MIIIKKLVSLCLVVSLLTSCGSSSTKTEGQNDAQEKTELPGKTANSGDDNIVKFSVNGAEVNSTGHNISRFIMNGKLWLNITSSMHVDGRTVNMNIESTMPGSYAFGSDIKVSHGGYYPSYLKEMNNSYNFVSGNLKLISVDTVKNIVNATFSGIVSNDKNEQLEIKDGQVINGKLKKGVTKF